MQTEAPLENGDASNHVNHQPNGLDHSTTPPPQPLPEEVSHVNSESFSESGDIPHEEDNGIDAPPNKKRKLTDPPTGKRSAPGSRPISPPWKRIAVEGPTSFVEEGRRKSSRTNYVPVGLLSQADKRKTRAAINQGSPVNKSKYGGAYKGSPLTTSASPQRQTPSNAKLPQSAGRPAVNTVGRPPTKRSKPPSAPTTSDDAPPPPKRSHKKKIRPPPESPIPSHSPQPSNPHQTRRAARGSEIGTTPSRAQGPTTNGWHANEEDTGDTEEAEELVEVDPNQRFQRLSLTVRMPTVNVQHPGHVLPIRKFESFQEWFEKEGRLGLEVGDPDSNMTERSASEEARLRTRINEAAKPGGLLSEDRCSFYKPEKFDLPPRQYTNQDRLAAHAVYFQKLLGQENAKHRRNAKECARMVADFVQRREQEQYKTWKQGQPRTEEEIAQEQHDAAKEVWEQIMEDLKRKWAMVTEIVEANRLQRWQEEQERLGKEALNEVIDKSEGYMMKQRTRRTSHGSDEESADDDASSDEGSGSGSEADSEDEVNMSSSQSDSDEDQAAVDDDAGLTQEELRQKYATVPALEEDQPSDSKQLGGDHIDTNVSRDDPAPDQTKSDPAMENDKPPSAPDLTHDEPPHSPVAMDEVDDALMDDSDRSTDMDDDDDDDDTGDSDESSEEDASDDEQSADEAPAGLLGFFSKEQLEPDPELANQENNDASRDEDEASEDEAEEVSLIPDATQGPTPSATTSEEPHTEVREEQALSITRSGREVEATTGANTELSTSKAAEEKPPPQDFRSLIQDTSLPTTPMSNNPSKTPIPSLLRGTLREYQHFGLDWLAGLYAAGTNGILADEMGLGKTIQTIALLAHLAVEHEVWGPHLIVVPTSVMLNWEIEFKKFLPGFKIITYYGTQEERRKKRQGWLNDDKWNVWITSYTLITNDQQIFKKKAWHYMILDEAHNIKNFQSLRWQTLLTFRTRARLLLTGTPLQNNLTELWSLLFFLMPADSSETGIGGFADLQEFTDWFRKPVEQILEHGRDVMDDDARAIVAKLHRVLRPFLLRRLKADVEKQMPGKYEHVVYCKLSKRQRYLYDGFMSRAQTRETLASGNTFSIMNALMQLRKVCNHPDLFETRQITTSFAMPRSAVADFEIKELLVRRRLLQDNPINLVDLNTINLLPGANEEFSALETVQRQRVGALGAFRQFSSQQWARIDHNLPFDATSVETTLASYASTAKYNTYERLRQAAYLTSLRSQRRPLYSRDKIERLKFGITTLPHPPMPERRAQLSEWYSRMSPALQEMVLTLPKRAKALETTVQKFACVTPSVVATDMAPLTLCRNGVEVVQSAKQIWPQDPFHEARMRLSIAFPDKRLLQYDCGKLQRLDTLLRTLQAGGHRALIFTQMTKVLDILEQFLNIHGHRYLRLDGATKIEQRQVLTERFNRDDRILAFILSSRSGGIGINLTGADTVIFYDLDWNPAMDKQCQDRCHRIGQTRDVHIYRLVSEYTIEANILRKANQKRMLDDVVIQEGEFTTDYFNNMSVKDVIGDEGLDDRDADANAAMDRMLGGVRGTGRVFEAVEDQEDIAAAKEAEKEMANEAFEFDEKGAATPKTPGPTTLGEMMPPPKPSQDDDVERTTTMEAAESGLAHPAAMPPQEAEEEVPSCDDYMLRFIEREFEDIPVQPPFDKNKKKSKKGKELGHRRR
ncbi:MAG: swr1 complex component [Alectoria sarmentosa]|nr:MAG: swr1 complex component [Alectoria sarmentosa]